MRIRRTFFRQPALKLITGIMATTALLGIAIQPTQAEESLSSDPTTPVKANAYNGYYIENLTDEVLVFKEGSVIQHSDGDCHTFFCYSHGKGFGVFPPPTIEPTQKGYFEIPAWVYYGSTVDDTSFVYISQKTKKEISVHPNVTLWWKLGFFSAMQNDSDCDATFCTPYIAQRRGKKYQTIFKIRPFHEDVSPGGTPSVP